mmetsp:Transcript_28804/g.86473  ORF Transcript_28804/g.86473 Transcript_28804/m.86473 type:complete len:91 (+) Transcript_28804:1121-1393(+)
MLSNGVVSVPVRERRSTAAGVKSWTLASGHRNITCHLYEDVCYATKEDTHTHAYTRAHTHKTGWRLTRQSMTQNGAEPSFNLPTPIGARW